MSYPFNPHQDLIVVRAELEGPVGVVTPRLALDTGANRTVLSTTMLVAAGYDPAAATSHRRVTTGSGFAFLPILLVSRLKALGQERTNMPIFGHTLPSGANIDGVLGLDFLRGLTLTVDFRLGQIDLV